MIKETVADPLAAYFNGNELAMNVWPSKYALREKGVKVEITPDDMHRRLAHQFFRKEMWYNGGLTINSLSEEQIYELLEGFRKVLPQGSVMASLGASHIGSLSNCVVLAKLFDSYGGIMLADQQLVQLMKRRCGAGLDISPLRFKGSIVSNAAQSSTGAVSFMPRFSNSTREVAQDGRRGALMITMDIRHPESEDFALSKQDLSKITGANISLRITDEFMRSVEEGTEFRHTFPIESDNVVKICHAPDLWNTIVTCAHNTAEPGLIFWDRQHRYSTSSLYPGWENISTNPCSEIAMNNDTCRLIALNMFGAMGFPFTKRAFFDFREWYDMCYNGMRLMDDLVDLEVEAMNKIIKKVSEDDSEPYNIRETEIDMWNELKNNAINGRRTGLGLTALGDVIAALGMRYDSEEAIMFFEDVCKVKLGAELDSMMDMAEERGAFPLWNRELEAQLAEQHDTFYHMIKKEFPEKWERMQKVGRRNISWSTIAPGGSISLLAALDEKHFGTTSGIEPAWAIVHYRKKKINANDDQTRVDFVDAQGDRWIEFPIFHEGFKLWYETCVYVDDQTPLHQLNKQQIDHLISNSPYAGSTAPEINWKNRIRMQAVGQKYITHSISSTINLPKDVSVEQVSDIYFEAWRQGLKGITIYRDGSRDGVLTLESAKDSKESFEYHDAPKRPKELEAKLTVTKVKGNSYAVIVGFLHGKPYEVFAFDVPDSWDNCEGTIIKRKKGHYDFYCEGEEAITGIQNGAIHNDEKMLTRLISGMLRHGVNPMFIIEQIEKCPLEVVSFSKALARVMKKYLPEDQLIKRTKCKNCGGTNLKFEEGCATCLDCGSSKCG